jgi:hypothetical protein
MLRPGEEAIEKLGEMGERLKPAACPDTALTSIKAAE